MECIRQLLNYQNTMELTKNWSFLEAAVEEIIAPSPANYSMQQLYKTISQYSGLTCQTIPVKSKHPNQQFNGYYVSKAQSEPQQSKTCIIYLHGLSSQALEGTYLLPFIQHQYSLFLYDLRGHGRNTCRQVTYGIEEAHDLYHILEELSIQKKIEKFYLWGRSMGAGVCLQFLSQYSLTHPSFLRDKIRGVVLDSCYSSFSKIVKEIAHKTASLPMFISTLLSKSLFSKIEKKFSINLNELDFCKLDHIGTPAAFVFSEEDQVVEHYHSQAIIQTYGGNKVEFKGSFKHNETRPSQLINKIISHWQKHENTPSFWVKRSSTPRKSTGLSVSMTLNNSNHQISQENSFVSKHRPPSPLMPNSCRSTNSSYQHSMRASGVQRRKAKLQTCKHIQEEVFIRIPQSRIFKPHSSRVSSNLSNQQNICPPPPLRTPYFPSDKQWPPAAMRERKNLHILRNDLNCLKQNCHPMG